MKIAYFDLIGGASGDMILGALLDTGLSYEALAEGLGELHLEGYSITRKKVLKNGFSATQVEVKVTDPVTERHLSDILSFIQTSHMQDSVKKQATSIFERLGKIEAGIHSVEVEKVHLHELGGIDTIIDVVGALLGLHLLQVEQVFCSPFPIGRGFVHGAHGLIPLPSPATAALLQGVPVRGSDIEKELVTPTGAAILTGLAVGYGSIPSMTLGQIGYGAGGRDLPVPNLLRLMLGEHETEMSLQFETLTFLETNIDDLNPQVYDYLIEQLFSQGALDVTLTPIHMKKNRPAIQVAVLCKQETTHKLMAILFAETSTLGIRKYDVERYALPRSFSVVKTQYGEVRMKMVEYAPGKQRAAPEYEDCRKLALEHGVPLMVIYKSALDAPIK
jgi:pyridinium-3,5-bisthiocarboxylic acid mononucleotide nickel chelatase